MAQPTSVSNIQPGELVPAIEKVHLSDFELLESSMRKHAEAHSNGESVHLKRDLTFHSIYPLALDEERNNGFLAGVSNVLERLTQPRIHIGSRDFSSYHVFGALGILLAGVIALSLTYSRGLSISIMIGLFIVSAAVSWLNVYLTKKITGKDRLVFLRYFLPMLACGVLFLRIIGQPVLLYIEALMLGIGAMQGVGRIGCFMVGCCHGKPARIGFRYSEEHARYGFPRRLLNLRLFPVQLLESVWIFVSVGTGIGLVLMNAEPGLGLAVYLVMFSAGRFCLELIRGDRWRRHFGYFSEAQWVSYGIITSVCLLSRYDVLPFRWWYIVVWGVVSVLMITLVNWRRSEDHPIDEPLHRSEVVRSLFKLDQGRRLPQGDAVHVRTTSRSLQLSQGRVYHLEGDLYHYTLSFKDRKMQLRDARALANIILNWHPHPGKTTLIEENSHIFHLIRSSVPFHPLTGD